VSVTVGGKQRKAFKKLKIRSPKVSGVYNRRGNEKCMWSTRKIMQFAFSDNVA